MARDWIDQYNRDSFTRTHAALLGLAGLFFGIAGYALLTHEHPSDVASPASPRSQAASALAASSANPADEPPPVQQPAPQPTATPPRKPAPASAPASAPTSVPAARVAWPSSDAWLHFGSGSTPQPLKWTSPRTDPILAPPIVWAAQATRDEGGQIGHARLVRFIREHRQGARIGRYFSCCTIRPVPQYTPPESVPADAVQGFLLPASWSPQEPTRRYVDIRRPEARQLLARLFVTTARRDDFLALDNFVFEFGGNPDGTTVKEWSDANYALLAEIYGAARQTALPVVINAATRPEQTWARVTQFCDGILFEMPFHPNIRKAPPEMERELAAYRAALDAGKFVGLVPLTPPKQTVAQKSDEERMVAAGAMLIREPGDALFVSQTHYQPTPLDWMEWPARFGKALGKYRRQGTTFTREFERATLTVEWITGRVVVGPPPAPAPSGR